MIFRMFQYCNIELMFPGTNYSSANFAINSIELILFFRHIELWQIDSKFENFSERTFRVEIHW